MFRNSYVVPSGDCVTKHYSPLGDSFNPDYKPVCNSVGVIDGAMPVDQIDAQEFMMGENGFHRSDISVLMTSQNEDLKKSIAARWCEIKSSLPDQSLSDVDLAKMAVPRYCQSASSLRDWMASLENGSISKSVSEFIKSHTKFTPTPSSNIEFEKSDKEIVDNV